MTNKHLIGLIIGLLLAASFAWLTLHDVDFSTVWHILTQNLDVTSALGAILAYAAFFWFKTLRWHYLLTPVTKIRTSKLVPYVLIGYAGNIILPFQAGEATRGYLLSRHHSVAAMTAISSIALEKLFDFFAVLTFTTVALFLVNIQSTLLETIVVSVASVLLVCVFILIALITFPQHTGSAIDALFNRLPKHKLMIRLRRWSHETIDGLMSLRQATIIMNLVTTTLFAWLCMLISLYLAINAVQIEAGFAISAIVLFLAAVGLALPTSPGFIGTIQAAFVFGMLPFGFSNEDAVAASIVYHALITVIPLITGLLCAVGLGVGSISPSRN